MFNYEYIKEIENAKEIRLQRFMNANTHEKVIHIKVDKLSPKTLDYLHKLSMKNYDCPKVPFKIVDVYFRKEKSIRTLTAVVLPEGDPWKTTTKALYIKRTKLQNK